MIVLDASVLLELLLSTPTGQRVAGRIAAANEGLHVPHLADLEVAQVLRRFLREKALDVTSAAAALEDLRALDLDRHAHEPYLGRIWELRDELSAYDAAYVSLAEVLDCTLLTCDRRLAAAARQHCLVELVS